MSYTHIENLYKDTAALDLFREVYALEKIHGTSAFVVWDRETDALVFSPGSGSRVLFEAMFDHNLIREVLAQQGRTTTIHGEYYGGSCHKMSDTYGRTPKFVVFDIKVRGADREGTPKDCWLSVPQMDELARALGLEVVFWEKIPCTIEAINAARDADSVQAVRNGMGPGHRREGVVLRPLIELTKNNGERVLFKHRYEKFRERASLEPDLAAKQARQDLLVDASAIAEEWVVPMRLAHVLDKIQPPVSGRQDIKRVLQAMVEDVTREAEGEASIDDFAVKAIERRTANMFLEHLNNNR